MAILTADYSNVTSAESTPVSMKRVSHLQRPYLYRPATWPWAVLRQRSRWACLAREDGSADKDFACSAVRRGFDGFLFHKGDGKAVEPRECGRWCVIVRRALL